MFINVVIISYHNNNKNIFFIYLLNVCVCVTTNYHGNISLKDLFDELVFGGVNQLNDVTI